MTFFATIWATCTGFHRTPELAKQSAFRATCHLLFLCIICLAAITASFSFFGGKELRKKVDNFFALTGGIQLAPDAISLLNKPATPRSVMLASHVEFNYFPGDSFSPEMIKDWTSSVGLTCLSNALVFWYERSAPEETPNYEAFAFSAQEIYSLFANPNHDATALMLSIDSKKKTALSKPALANFIESQIDLPDEPEPERKPLENHAVDSAAGAETPHSVRPAPELPGKVFVLQAADLQSNLLAAFSVMAFFRAFLDFLAAIPISLAIFALVELLRTRLLKVPLSFSSIYAMTVYAMFPALIVASLFQILPQTYLSFSVVFFLVFAVYQMIAFNRLFLLLKPYSPPDNSDDDDF